MGFEDPKENSYIYKDDKQLHSLDAIEHELIEKYKPVFLARGGEHLVYAIPSHPEIVAKVSLDTVEVMMRWNELHENPLDDMSSELMAHAREYIAREGERYAIMKGFFGADHVVSQKKFPIKIPFSEIRKMHRFNEEVPDAIKDVWGIMTIQKKVVGLADPSHLSLVAGYAERSKNLSEGVYKKVTDHLIGDVDRDVPLREEQFLDVQSGASLKRLFVVMREDGELRDVVREIITKILDYAENTNEIIDLAAQDNLSIYRKDGRWTYALIDTLYSGQHNMLGLTRDIVDKLVAGHVLDGQEENILLNAVNFTRTVNGIAEQLSLKGRISLIPDGVEYATDLLSALRLSR